MPNKNANVLSRTIARYKVGKPRMMKDIGYIAEQFFKASFRKQSGDGKSWKPRKWNPPGKQRAILMNTGKLRDNIKSTSTSSKAIISNRLPYAAIHNDGGTITITPKMRAFFWAMFFSVMEGAKNKSGNASSLAKASQLKSKALPWLYLAKHKGNTLTIPERPFIYHSKDLNAKIDRYIDKFIKDIKK
jgi:phage gpG-like protein